MASFENIQPLMLILIASMAFGTAVFQSVSGFAGGLLPTAVPLRIHPLFMEIIVVAGAGYFLWRAGRGFGWL